MTGVEMIGLSAGRAVFDTRNGACSLNGSVQN